MLQKCIFIQVSNPATFACVIAATNYVLKVIMISNTRDSASSGYADTEKGVKNIRRSEVFLRNSRSLDSRLNTVSGIWYIFSIETKTKELFKNDGLLMSLRSDTWMWALLSNSYIFERLNNLGDLGSEAVERSGLGSKPESLCSVYRWTRHSTLAMSLSTQVGKINTGGNTAMGEHLFQELG